MGIVGFAVAATSFLQVGLDASYERFQALLFFGVPVVTKSAGFRSRRDKKIGVQRMSLRHAFCLLSD